MDFRDLIADKVLALQPSGIRGYSAYFTHMSTADQNDYIQRFEHSV